MRVSRDSEVSIYQRICQKGNRLIALGKPAFELVFLRLPDSKIQHQPKCRRMHRSGQPGWGVPLLSRQTKKFPKPARVKIGSQVGFRGRPSGLLTHPPASTTIDNLDRPSTRQAQKIPLRAGFGLGERCRPRVAAPPPAVELLPRLDGARKRRAYAPLAVLRASKPGACFRWSGKRGSPASRPGT
jgi:hypothetical protein